MGSNLSVTNLNVMFTWHIDLRYVIKLSQTKSYIDAIKLKFNVDMMVKEYADIHCVLLRPIVK